MRGLYGALHGDGDSAALDRDLGAGFMIETTAITCWPVCEHLFTALDALQAVRHAHPMPLAAIETVDVRIYPQALDVAKVNWPHSVAEGSFSPRDCLARLLAHGRLDDIDPHDAELIALGQRIRVLADADYGKAFPRQSPCTVTLRLRDGSERCATRATRHGDPEDPLTRDELLARFAAIAPQAGDARIDAIANWCDTVATGGGDAPVSIPSFLFV
jgi:2-methylcitrate dehydratase PrpD